MRFLLVLTIVACARHKAPPTAEVTCDDEFGARICFATLDPTKLGAGIQPVESKLSHGPGKHFYCYPEAQRPAKLLVHIVGTFSDPAEDNAFARRACALGYAAIVPMYVNTEAMGTRCADDGACYGAARDEVITGVDRSPILAVDRANSLANRVATLLAHLHDNAAFTALADAVARDDYSHVAVSGHSQGSGMALILARDHAVERLVMLGGVVDRIHTNTPQNAAPDWIAHFTAKTPAARFYGFNHTDDTLARFTEVNANYDALGVAPDRCPADAATYPASCRRVAIPSQGCSGLLAHSVEVRARYGNRLEECAIHGDRHDNAPAWKFVLTN